jgi:hypothetical protein
MRTRDKQLRDSKTLASALRHIQDAGRIIISDTESMVLCKWLAPLLDFVVESICAALKHLGRLKPSISHLVVDPIHLLDFIGRHKEAMRRFFDERLQTDKPMPDTSLEARSVELAMLIWPFLWKTLVSYIKVRTFFNPC